ncbi:MAG: starch-binding protein, partial [Paludibacteraceae bacterium]|nr:starch-binding protein [Paludibacteraceae bacterium]
MEEKFTVTISNDGNGTTTPSGEQQVGASGISVTATAKEGYRFKNWTATTGITITNTTSATTTIKASQAGTVTANFEVEPCVYFINTGNWSNVYIHAWKDGGENTTWPGTKLSKVDTINGYDVYKYVRPSGKSYNEVLFHNNDGTQTADLEWVNGKYYDFYQGKWFDRNEFEAMVSKIYFKNTLGWKNVYLYTFSTDVWVADKGVKPKNSRYDYGKMTQIANTDIFYYEISNCNFAHIAFSDADMSGNNEFYQNNAVYRSDHDYKMALFIPQKDQTPSTTNSTKYYSSGLWMKYNSTESGYNLVGGFNSWNDNADKFTAGSTGVYQFEVEMNLGASSTYEFKIKKDGINDWFGKNSTTITSTVNSNIIFVSQEENVKITTTSAGIHIFSIDLSEGKLNLSVEYPLAKGDYRMVYIESETKGTEPYTKFHPAQSIRGITDGEKLDTVS